VEYTIQVRSDHDFESTIDALEDALAAEGFGILSDIDFKATFAKKLDEEFVDYRVLGACNPPFAYDALEEEIEVGALLPCNVVVRSTAEGEVYVDAVDPETVIGIAENPALDEIATEIKARLEDALAEVAA
jgi:uncharacterized protein (DUF302 family)